MPRPVLPPERLWERVQRADGDGCWEFIGSRQKFGHGLIGVNGRVVKAHRLAWELTYGPIPDGMLVCHRCDNPPCCRPDHLFLGTARDNTQDAIVKNRRGAPPVRRGEQHPHRKLAGSDVVEIRRLLGLGSPQKDLAARFGIGAAQMSRIANGKQWKGVESVKSEATS